MIFGPEKKETPNERNTKPEIIYRYYHDEYSDTYFVEKWYNYIGWQNLRDFPSEKEAKIYIKALNTIPNYKYYNGE